jgi:hypothetical protein
VPQQAPRKQPKLAPPPLQAKQQHVRPQKRPAPTLPASSSSGDNLADSSSGEGATQRGRAQASQADTRLANEPTPIQQRKQAAGAPVCSRSIGQQERRRSFAGLRTPPGSSLMLPAHAEPRAVQASPCQVIRPRTHSILLP